MTHIVVLRIVGRRRVVVGIIAATATTAAATARTRRHCAWTEFGFLLQHKREDDNKWSFNFIDDKLPWTRRRKKNSQKWFFTDERTGIVGS